MGVLHGIKFIGNFMDYRLMTFPEMNMVCSVLHRSREHLLVVRSSRSLI